MTQDDDRWPMITDYVVGAVLLAILVGAIVLALTA